MLSSTLLLILLQRVCLSNTLTAALNKKKEDTVGERNHIMLIYIVLYEVFMLIRVCHNE